jgi:phospholipid/cholesterol/gamma-HCH transport system permease protein
MTASRVLEPLSRLAERAGRSTIRGIEEFGFAASLLGESLYWILLGPHRGQPVRIDSVFRQMMEIGIYAIPIVTVLSAAIGVMLAIQGIDTLKTFGAESQVVIGIALSMTREFAPMITGILVAGRSGSALAARLGTMKINEELDALEVMGINPVRFLAVPALLGMVVMLPALTFWSNFVGLTGAALFVSADLGMSVTAYFEQTRQVLDVGDLTHGLSKSVLFAVLVTLVGVINGASVTGGAEGVGRVTTRSVVHSIAAIVIADMVVAFLLTR